MNTLKFIVESNEDHNNIVFCANRFNPTVYYLMSFLIFNLEDGFFLFSFFFFGIGCAYSLCKKDGLCSIELLLLQATVNRSKGNRTEISKEDLIQKSSYCRVSGICMSCKVFFQLYYLEDISQMSRAQLGLFVALIIMAVNLIFDVSAGRDMDLLELSAYGNVR
ncbi:unnamed protein product [Camellia sinensis]